MSDYLDSLQGRIYASVEVDGRALLEAFGLSTVDADAALWALAGLIVAATVPDRGEKPGGGAA